VVNSIDFGGLSMADLHDDSSTIESDHGTSEIFLFLNNFVISRFRIIEPCNAGLGDKLLDPFLRPLNASMILGPLDTTGEKTGSF
jgi:hypothetical protein